MSLTIPTEDRLRRTGGLKWTGVTASDGSPTIGAWVAEMDFGTAPDVAAAMKGAIDDGLLGYQPTWLEGRVAEALSDFHSRRFGWDVPSHQVRLVESVLPALRATIANLIPAGAPVVVPTPAYMPFLTIPGALDHPVVEVPSHHGEGAEGGWELDLAGIDAALEAGAKLVILCNPWNPTGRVLTERELRALQAVVSDHDALVFSDEIHSPLVLTDPGAFTSYARLGPEFAAHTITATAASKGWNIAGLPCAQVILPDDELRARWDTFAAGVRHGANTLGALGTIAAYTRGDAWQAEVRRVVESNLDTVEEALADTPIDFTRPQGTYLTWWGFGAVNLGGTPATVLREKAHIATNDGHALGRGWGNWARVNLACSPEVTREIVSRVLALLP